MPTTRPRHAITETPEITRALEVARRRWPAHAESPSRLLRELIAAGADAVEESTDSEIERRLAALTRIAGRRTDWFPDGYLENLRSEWPD
ncbi:hypothetical protein FK529_03230 [Tsukamurella asaccharolytica]|uniref:Uncharacterized protein n=1 Tax=Tsukamurella asaccharolytica TaxID=2592067 RepID=A0A5C5RE91_9ACTN|nr:hypothetical protein [Tsukamurella asaccharolytica]TWS20381.1 hypothetical protein FK529_03230 [Tsukamurella asaccharolytica]